MTIVCEVLLNATLAAGVLLSPAELAGMADAIVVDSRPAEAYEAGHIPDSVPLDTDSLSEEQGGVTNMLLPLQHVRATLAGKGLDPAKTVVIYSAMESAPDTKRATRLFWALEYYGYPSVAVLDGGLAAWTAEERPVSTDATAPAPLDVEALASLAERPELVATHDEVMAIVRAQTADAKGAPALLMDMRPPEQYSGLATKPGVERSGNIPGAVNLPAGELVAGEYNRFQDADAMRELIGAALPGGGEGDPSRRLSWGEETPIVTYCNSGRDATVGYFAWRLLGREGVAVYDGSMADWGKNR